MELSGSRVEMDINNIIENSLIRMLNKKKRSVSIHKQLGEIPCPVGFPDQIENVIQIFLHHSFNNIEGKGKIFISTWRSKDFVKIAIRDIGGTKRRKRRIEKSLHRSTLPFTGKPDSQWFRYMQSIILSQGGSLEVFGKSGTGTEFVMTLPLK